MDFHITSGRIYTENGKSVDRTTLFVIDDDFFLNMILITEAWAFNDYNASFFTNHTKNTFLLPNVDLWSPLTKAGEQWGLGVSCENEGLPVQCMSQRKIGFEFCGEILMNMEQ